jgi:hypothetical protein
MIAECGLKEQEDSASETRNPQLQRAARAAHLIEAQKKFLKQLIVFSRTRDGKAGIILPPPRL